MKPQYILLSLCLVLAGCSYLDLEPEKKGTLQEVFEDRTSAEKFLYGCYGYLPASNDFNGEPQVWSAGDEVALTSQWGTDWHWAKAAHTGQISAAEPLYNYWSHHKSKKQPSRCAAYDLYGGIRQCYTFIDMVDGVPNASDGEKARWKAEAKFLIAYFHYSLLRLYGPICLVNGIIPNDAPEEVYYPTRRPYDECVSWIARKFDEAAGELKASRAYSALDMGRANYVAALAIKSRMLLYAASPQFNPSGEKSKWAAAAAAAFEVINMGIYSLHPDYGGLFVAETSTTSPETIWAVRMGATNEFERKNYPIGTQGGGTGICPSQNLVEAYESTGEDTGDAYAGLDPRFYATVLRNGDTWNGRTLEIYAGGADDPARQNASPTGYYLRKFLNENLNLTNDDKRLRSWIVFRYAEILLNFAEAMNEAYGPDDAHGYGMSARDAVDAVRARSGVGMPPVDVDPGDAAAMRTAIKHERRIELAFEDHRYWDLRRWDDAGTVLNRPLRGVKVTRSGDGFAYTPFEVAKRIFDAPKMNLYPIPQAEIVKSGGVLDQNPGW